MAEIVSILLSIVVPGAVEPGRTAAPDASTKHFKSINRYRGVLVSADGHTIYIAANSCGPTAAEGLTGLLADIAPKSMHEFTTS